MVIEATDPKVKLNKALCTSTNIGFGYDETNLLHELLKRYSNWSRPKRAVAWLLRFVLILKPIDDHSFSRFLSVEELDQVELAIIKLVQRHSFEDALKCLPNHTDFNELFRLNTKKELNKNYIFTAFLQAEPYCCEWSFESRW